MKRCPQCGYESFSNEPDCPACGRTPPTLLESFRETWADTREMLASNHRVPVRFLLQLGAWVAGLVLLAAIVSNSTNSSAAPANRSEANAAGELVLDARAKLSSFYFTVTNADSFDWYNVEIILQTGFFGYYSYKLARLSSGDAAEVLLRDFTSGGKRFPADTRVPELIIITGYDADGRKGYAGFQP